MKSNWRPVDLNTYPRLIRVGAVDYVLEPHHAHSEDWGSMDGLTSTITVSPKLSAGRFALTLLHELTHAMIEEFGVLDGTPIDREKGEEALVVQLATAMATTMQNNPYLFHRIINELSDSIVKETKDEQSDR